ncbi:MAG TPA: gluconokinase [Gemmataceae bacterium]|nr:gluconokinase [Gemmataceae bacterium]
MIVVLMGVSGSGKSTVGKVLAGNLGWAFVEADDYHPPGNVEKLRRGEPLTDADRRPWLDALRRRIDDGCTSGENVVLACSALKHSYRDYLEQDDPPCVHYVWLDGPPELIRQRLAERKGHFMDPALLPSQFQTLEQPADAVRVDITPGPEAIAADVRKRLGL